MFIQAQFSSCLGMVKANNSLYIGSFAFSQRSTLEKGFVAIYLKPKFLSLFFFSDINH